MCVELLAPVGLEARHALNSLWYTDSCPQQRIILSRMFILLRLRYLGEKINQNTGNILELHCTFNDGVVDCIICSNICWCSLLGPSMWENYICNPTDARLGHLTFFDQWNMGGLLQSHWTILPSLFSFFTRSSGSRQGLLHLGLSSETISLEEGIRNSQVEVGNLNSGPVGNLMYMKEKNFSTCQSKHRWRFIWESHVPSRENAVYLKEETCFGGSLILF